MQSPFAHCFSEDPTGFADNSSDIDWSEFDDLLEYDPTWYSSPSLTEPVPPSLTTGSTNFDEHNVVPPWSDPQQMPFTSQNGPLAHVYTGVQFHNGGHENFNDAGDVDSFSLPHDSADLDLLAITLPSNNCLPSPILSLNRSVTYDDYAAYTNTSRLSASLHGPQETGNGKLKECSKLEFRKEIERPSCSKDATWVHYTITGSVEKQQDALLGRLNAEALAHLSATYASSKVDSTHGSVKNHLKKKHHQCRFCSTPPVRFRRRYDLSRHMSEQHSEVPISIKCTMENPYVRHLGGCPAMKKHGVEGTGCGEYIKRSDYFLRGHLKMKGEEIKRLKAQYQASTHGNPDSTLIEGANTEGKTPTFVQP